MHMRKKRKIFKHFAKNLFFAYVYQSPFDSFEIQKSIKFKPPALQPLIFNKQPCIYVNISSVLRVFQFAGNT